METSPVLGQSIEAQNLQEQHRAVSQAVLDAQEVYHNPDNPAGPARKNLTRAEDTLIQFVKERDIISRTGGRAS